MKLPRIILNPAVGAWIRLWQRERQLNAQLRRELLEWQSKYLQAKGATSLFTPPGKTEVTDRPPVGQNAKNAYLARKKEQVNHPTAEQVLGLQ